MAATMNHTGELNWLLDELVSRVAQVRHAVVLSRDGLALGVSAGLGREDGEHLAAVASGFHSLAKGTGRHFNAGEVRQTMVELDGGFLFVGHTPCFPTPQPDCQPGTTAAWPRLSLPRVTR